MRPNSFQVRPPQVSQRISPKPAAKKTYGYSGGFGSKRKVTGLCSLPKIARTFAMKTYAPNSVLSSSVLATPPSHVRCR
jgi:hypothetical protein